MKTDEKKSLETKTANCLIAEIYESIEQIKTQLVELRKSDKSQPRLYVVAAEIANTERSLEQFEIQLLTLSKIFA